MSWKIAGDPLHLLAPFAFVALPLFAVESRARRRRYPRRAPVMSMRKGGGPEQKRVELILDDDEALALAEFVRRAGGPELRTIARNHVEAERMYRAAAKLRQALAESVFVTAKPSALQ